MPLSKISKVTKGNDISLVTILINIIKNYSYPLAWYRCALLVNVAQAHIYLTHSIFTPSRGKMNFAYLSPDRHKTAKPLDWVNVLCHFECAESNSKEDSLSISHYFCVIIVAQNTIELLCWCISYCLSNLKKDSLIS